MKLNKSKKDPELYYYFNTKGKKMWCYRHRYYDELGKRREKSKRGFIKENEAYRELLEVKTSIMKGEIKQVARSNITVSEWLDLWYDTHKNDWKVSTRIQRERVIRLQMKPLLGKYRLNELDKITYKRVFINELLKTLSPKTVQLCHQLFKIAINIAVDDEILTRNRFNNITIPKKKKEAENFLTAEELNIFLVAAKKRDGITNFTLKLLLAYTGLRKGEALGLTWKDLSLDEKTLTVQRTRDVSGVRPPKTKRSYRTILMDDLLINQLKKYRKWCKQKKLSFGKHLADDDFVFISSRSSNPINEHTLTKSMDRVLDNLNINRITPHGLRHTHATILIAQRIPVNVIADRLGNTPQMIYDVYGHTFKELEHESVAAFSKSLNVVGGVFGGD